MNRKKERWVPTPRVPRNHARHLAYVTVGVDALSGNPCIICEDPTGNRVRINLTKMTARIVAKELERVSSR